jgi:hypothetical protein
VLADEVRRGRVVRDGDRYRLDGAFDEDVLAAIRAAAPDDTDESGRRNAMTQRPEPPRERRRPIEVVWMTPTELRRLPVHRHAGLFRPLEGDERERLRESMRNGYDPLHPIVVAAGTEEIVDGRNRRDLAVELGLTAVPIFRCDFAGDAEITAFIVRANLARRHLSARERRELAARLVNGHGLSTRQAARQAGVSQMTAQRAAARERLGESNDSPARTTGADGTSYPATRSTTLADKVRAALGLLSGLAGHPVPVELHEALSDDGRAKLTLVLDALAKEPPTT